VTLRTLLPLLCALGLALAVACGDDGNDANGDVPGGPEALVVYEGARAGAVNVYTINVDTGEAVQLTDGGSFDGNPSWSPDRERIIYVSRGDGTVTDVFVMNADGSDPVRITDTPDIHEWSPRFSPDGARIAYTLNDGDEWYLGVRDADGSNPRRIAGPYAFAEFPAWSPDGEEIWFSAREDGARAAHIYSVPSEGGEVLTRIATPGSDVCPQFSRDGSRLTYGSRDPDVPQNIDLFAHDPADLETRTENTIRLSDSPGIDDYASPSPDDSRMVFISNRTGTFELWVMDADGTNVRQVSDSADIRKNVPQW
jgi:TolB protein